MTTPWSDFVVAMELSCREPPNVAFYLENKMSLPEHTLKSGSRSHDCPGCKGIRVGDKVFLIEFPGRKAKSARILFCLEADRGTMPISRRSDKASSFERKLLSYSATLQTGVHRSQFGVDRLRVITVAPSFERVKNLREATAQLAKRSDSLYSRQSHRPGACGAACFSFSTVSLAELPPYAYKDRKCRGTFDVKMNQKCSIFKSVTPFLVMTPFLVIDPNGAKIRVFWDAFLGGAF